MKKNFIFRVINKIRYNYQRLVGINYYKGLGIDYCNEEQLAKSMNIFLSQHIPICIGKIGGNELNSVFSAEIISDKYTLLSFERLCHYAGFFPNRYDQYAYSRYIALQRKAIESLDYIIRFDKLYEEHILRKYKKDELKYIDAIGSWQQIIPWTKELKGYRVVVVHPFAELIEKQYRNREKIYPNADILPEFNLRVVKAVQTIANSGDNRFSSWFEALDYMYSEIMREDFDIALIGCGAYGLPLAAKVKEAGKIGVHMGGDLQMLFGIRGKRWDDRELAKRWFNDYWVRPTNEYKVEGFDSIEGGCYW